MMLPTGWDLANKKRRAKEMTIEREVKIKISNIVVDERYYEFDFEYENGQRYENGVLGGEHEWEIEEWLDMLVNGEAVKLVLERIAEDM